MSKTLCGIDCSDCLYDGSCGGCIETGGRPLGGDCMLFRACSRKGANLCGGNERYLDIIAKLKAEVIAEFNALGISGMPEVTELFPLVGDIVNFEYILPGGAKAKFFDDTRIYLAAQLEKSGQPADDVPPACFGLVADEDYLMVCEYVEGGGVPKILAFLRRDIVRRKECLKDK